MGLRFLSGAQEVHVFPCFSRRRGLGPVVGVAAKKKRKNLLTATNISLLLLCMNILRSFLAILLAAGFSASAQTTATTDPVGFQSTTIQPGTSTLANPLVNSNITQSGVSANTASVITLSTISNVGSLLTADEPYYVEVISGTLEGERYDVDTAATIAAGNATLVINTSSSNNTSTLSSNTLSDASLALRKHVTLEQIQGYFSPGLIGSNSANSADQISLFNPVSGGLISYFLRADGITWRQVGTTTTANKTPIPSGTGFFITKRTAATTYTSVGSVRNNDFAFPMAGGSTFRAPGYPVSYSPSSLGGTASNQWTGNNSANSADQLQVFNPSTGGFTAYFLRGDGTTWRQVGTTTTVTFDQLFADNNSFMVLKRVADPNYILLNPVIQ